MRADLSWEDLRALRVVQKLTDTIGRRWGLALGYVSVDGRTVRPPRHEPAARRGLCPVIQDVAPGAASCESAARRIVAIFDELDERGALESSPIAFTCPSGLQEIAVPLVIDGRLVGALLAGGFVPAEDGDDDLAGAARRVMPLGIRPVTWHAGHSSHPRIPWHEIGWLDELLELIAEEIESFQTELAVRARQVAELERELGTRGSYDAIIGRSPRMQELYRMLDKVVASDSTVLLTGENGTGKELVARAVHFNSERRRGPFVVQNCAALNDNLLDSELFGHARGAFTGAVVDKQGLFEVADGGTFFLDEVGEMSPSLQVKLLRVLQEGTYTRVGEIEPRSCDVRIVAATNRELKKMVDRGIFREDLYYRINVINVVVPPLRERLADLPAMVDHFLKKHARGPTRGRRLHKACLDRMNDYAWPGNVRELENEIERLLVLAGDERVIGEELLSPRIRAAAPTAGEEAGLPGAVEQLERTMIAEALRRHGNNKTRVATELGISRRNLIRLCQKYELGAERRRGARPTSSSAASSAAARAAARRRGARS